jgi:small subunit ribosomal protein S20
MPHTKTAKKRMRQNEERRLHNRSIKKAIRKQIKQVLDVDQAGSVDDLRKEVTLAIKKLDKAAAKRVVHPNLAARKKSQLAKLLNQKAKVPAKAKT